MLISIQKYGFSTVEALLLDLHTQLTTAHPFPGATPATVQYFTCVFPAAGAPYTTGAGYPTEYVAVYETNTGINSLANFDATGTTVAGTTVNGKWRLAFVKHDADRFTVHAGSPLTLPSNGELIFMTNRASTTADLKYREPPGCLNIEPWSKDTAAVIFPAPPIAGKIYPEPDPDKPGEVFVSRKSSLGALASYPMNYLLSLSNRGMVLAIWEDNQEEVPEEAVPAAGYTDITKVYGNSPVKWFVIQRAVDREFGWVRGGFQMRRNANAGIDKHWGPDILAKIVPYAPEPSRCPVFCVFGTGQPNDYKKFIVRENDVLVPSPKKSATTNTIDSPAIINQYQQQSITENGEFVVTFINNLSTSRFRYGDELDMIGTVGAEVMGGGTSITVRVYGETGDRKYQAIYGNRPYGNGMRIMVLVESDNVNEFRSV